MMKKCFIICLTLITTLFLNILPAHAIGPSLRTRTRAITKAVRANVRAALKPSFTIRSRYAKAMQSVSLSADGKRLATGSSNGAAQIWELATGQRERNLQGDTGPVLAVAFIPGTPLLATGSKGGIGSLWNLETGIRQADFQKQSVPIHDVASDPGGHVLAFADGDGHIGLWDLKENQLIGNIKGHQGAALTVLLYQEGQRVISGGEDGQISVWEARTGTRMMQLSPDGGPVHSLAMGHNDTYLAAGLENGTIRVWDIANGQKTFLSEKGHDGPVRSVSISPDGKAVASVGDDKSLRVWSLADGKAIRDYTGHDQAVNAVSFTRNGQFLVTASNDMTARFWDRASGKEMARLISMKSGWAVVSPGGFFDGTLDGDTEDRLDAVQWAVENRSFGVDGFLEGYYRPALLGRLLAGESPAGDKQLPSISEGFKLPPEVTINDPKQDSLLREGEVSVTVEALNQGGGIDEIRVFHNGKILDDREAQQIKADKGKKEQRETKVYYVPLVDGKNIFRAVGFSSDRIESEPAEIAVVYDGVKKPPPPSLHVVVVGINQYQNPKQNLNFGVPDAKGVLGYFTSSYASLFHKLIQYELFDQEATRSSIFNTLRFLEKIPPQDTVVIYFAGHGETLRDKWYFVPHELDLLAENWETSLEEQGVSSVFLQLHIARIGARHILLLLDACKSGGVMDAFSAYADHRPFALLSRSTGIHIATAAKKEQYAGELDKLGHGLFTYTLLEALSGRGDMNPADGNISVQETLGYIRTQMPVLIKKHRLPSQKPVLNSRGMDFWLSIMRK